MDFVHDQLATGRKPRVLTIVNTFSRFSPEARADPRRGGLRYAAPHAEVVLDENLPSFVEWMVEAEIERVARRR